MLVKENACTFMHDKVAEAVKKTNLLHLNNDADVSSLDCPMFLVKKISKEKQKAQVRDNYVEQCELITLTYLFCCSN